LLHRTPKRIRDPQLLACIRNDSDLQKAPRPPKRAPLLGREAPKQVAVRCGFANADTLRRAFVRHIGVTTVEYRKRYAND
jgi:AraC-like DNA-binding protein